MNREDSMTAGEMFAALLADPCVRWVVKDAVRKMADADPVDALMDAQLILRYAVKQEREVAEKDRALHG